MDFSPINLEKLGKNSYKIRSMVSDHKKEISLNLPWLGILILIILAIAFLLPVLPNDFWWYLRLGKDILLNKAVPSIDTYSSTAFGTPVSYPMWLSAILLHLTYELGGLTAIVLVRGLMIGSFYILLWVISIKQGLRGWLVTILTLICALAGANNWAVRPQMFVYPLFGLTLLILEPLKSNGDSGAQGQIEKRRKRFFWLIPIAFFWANLHGSVILLFLLAGSYFLFYQRNRVFFFILMLSFLVTFINPKGPSMWLDTFQIMQASGNQFSQEWKAPSNNGWQMNIFFLWLLLFIPLAAFSKNKLLTYQWIWFLGFGWMALSGVRYVIWFLAILLIFSSSLLNGILTNKTKFLSFSNIKMNISLLILFSLLPLSLLPGVRETWWDASPPVISKNTPIDAAKWIQENIDPTERIFNDYLFGGYFIYALPEYPVWIDSRFYPYDESIWEGYLSISDGEPDWPEKLTQHQIKHLVLDNESQNNLISALKENDQFCQMYKDDISTIFSVCK